MQGVAAAHHLAITRSHADTAAGTHFPATSDAMWFSYGAAPPAQLQHKLTAHHDAHVAAAMAAKASPAERIRMQSCANKRAAAFLTTSPKVLVFTSHPCPRTPRCV